MKQFFKRYFFILDDDTKRKLPILVAIFIFSSLLDVIGIGMISAFLALIIEYPVLIKKLPISIQNIVVHHSETHVIFAVGIGLIGAFVFKGFFNIYAQKKIVMTTAQFVMRCKMRLLSAYQKADYVFHLKQNTGYLLNKISLVDNFSGNVLSTSLNIFSSLIVTLGVIGCIMWMHPLVTLFLSAVFGCIFILYELFVKNHLLRISKTAVIVGGEINKAVLQAMGGLKEIRVLGKEAYFIKTIADNALSSAKAQSSYNALQLIPRYVVESAASIFLVVLVLCAIAVGTKPAKMIPTLGVFAAACIRLLPVVSQLISQFGQIRSASYASGILFDEFTLLEQKKTHITHTKDHLNFSQFSLQNVFFRYENAKQNALEKVNITFKKGQSIGLIGASGAGKSTLVSIILGLITPDQGNLLVDNQPIINKRAWLNNFAYIPQSIFLLDDTMKRNIAMGTPDYEIDHSKLMNAIAMAQLSSVVEELPQGVDTLLGENGVRLSGGQRQRVALARAFYYDREIIVMDEATSALDNETEHEVIQAIKRLQGIKTLIVIAHRLTTIQHCDIVYKLEKGQVVAQGLFQEVVG